MRDESAALIILPRALTLALIYCLPFFIPHTAALIPSFTSAFVLLFRPSGFFELGVSAPQLDFVFEFDSVLASEALAYFFGERERAPCARVPPIRYDEICVDRRGQRAPPPLARHAHPVN